MGMSISGLVVTSDPEKTESVAAAIRLAGPFTLGERFGPRLTLTLETEDDHRSAEWFSWLAGLPGVVKADVAFVYFDAGEEGRHE